MTYRVPAEWEPPSCLWVAWPHNRETWPGRFETIPGFFASWIETIAESTPVRVLASAELAKECQSAVGHVRNVDLVDIATNDCWIRDYGPIFVRDVGDGSLHGVNWRFNAWGGKYAPYDLDDAVAPKLCQHQQLPCIDETICLEGGGLEFDGAGRVLTTPTCLLNPTRNEGATTESMALRLHQRLGVLEVVWLDGGGLAGDDTDGHIDQLARFIDPENVVVAVCDQPGDENHAPLEENYRQLRLWGRSTSPKVNVHRLPIPPARSIDNQRVPESYCNFIRLGSERLLVPLFGADSDDHACGLLRELSGADVVGIDCRDLIWGLGSLHCASLQQPA